MHLYRFCFITSVFLLAVAGTVLAETPTCDCRCELYEQMRQHTNCVSECSNAWKELKCATPAEQPDGQWDAETERYQAELQELGIEGSMQEIQLRAFVKAPPNERTELWGDLETLKAELAKDEMQELLKIRKQIEAGPSMDAETLNYKATLEKAGKTEAEVNGLVTLFSPSNARIRKALWDDLGVQQP